MQGRTSSTTTIFNHLSSSAKNFLGGLLVLSLPGVTIAYSALAQPQQPTLDSIYFYDPTRTSLYQLIVNSNGYARDMIELIREGLCGADATGSFPVVNFEKIGEWGWNNLATLLGAVNQELKQTFVECLSQHLQTRADLQQEATNNTAMIFGLLILGLVILSASLIAACCLYDRHQYNKWQKELDKSRSAAQETNKLLDHMEEGHTPSYGTCRPGG